MTGQELRQTRTRLKLTQEQLASHLKVAANTIARWERGEYPIPEFLHLALEALEARLKP